MTDALSALRAALADATPRPWRFIENAVLASYRHSSVTWPVARPVGDTAAQATANGNVIAHSVNLAPALLAVADAAAKLHEKMTTFYRSDIPGEFRGAAHALRAALAALNKEETND